MGKGRLLDQDGTPAAAPTGVAGGDLAGNFPNPTVRTGVVNEQLSTGGGTFGTAVTPANFTWGQLGVEGSRKLYHRMASGHGTADWYQMAETFSFEAGLYIDRTFQLGYNKGSNGARQDLAEPLIFLQFETKFRNNSGTPYGSEWHLNFYRPNVTTARRPLNVFMEHVADLIQVEISADTFNITDAAGTQRLTYSASTWFARGNWVFDSPSSGNRSVEVKNSVGSSIFDIDGAAANESRLSWSRGGVETWYAYLGGDTQLRFRDIANARNHLVMVPGTIPMNARCDFLAVAKWNHADFFQTTVGAAGTAAALPSAPTKYLRMQDNTGALVLVPCYAVP